MKHNIHRRTFWSSTKNTNTKRNNPRRHSKPILIHNISRTTSTMAAKWKYGYTLGTSKVTINSAAYADDLAIITNKLTSLQNQLNKLDKYCEWARMDLGITKCAITGCPNKSKMNQESFKAQIQATNITYRNQPIPILHRIEPYVYLGIQLIPSLKWKLQTHATTTKLINQCSQLANCLATIKQKINMVDEVIRARTAYSFYAVPYSLPTIIKLDKKIIAI